MIEEEQALAQEEEQRRQRYVEKQRKLGGASAARQRVVRARQQRPSQQTQQRSTKTKKPPFTQRRVDQRQHTYHSDVQEQPFDDGASDVSSASQSRRRGEGLDQRTIQAKERQRRLETQQRMVRLPILCISVVTSIQCPF